MHERIINYVVLLISLLVVGCGGGGSGGSSSAQTQNIIEQQEQDNVVVYEGVAFKNPENIEIDRIIVKLKTSNQNSKSLNSSASPVLLSPAATTLNMLRQVGEDTYVFILDKRTPLAETIAILNELQNDPSVEYVEPDWPIYPMATPNDPGFSSQWHYYDNGTVPGGANLPDAWDVTTGHSDIVVAVLDTGILATHPDFAGRLVAGYDFIASLPHANDGDGRDSNTEDPGNWCDDPAANSNWHGTHVGGTIGAASDNGLGGAGVDWQARIQPIRILGKCGGYSSDLIDAIRWSAGLSVDGIADNLTPAHVLNLSLGGPGTCGASLQAAIDAAVAAGSLVVVAAGNDADDAANYTPGVCNNVITVAAVGRDGEQASYTNYGTSVEIAAPGGSGIYSVYSATNDGTQSPNNHIYGGAMGTSSAAPHVSGIASLMLAANYVITNEFLSPSVLTDKLIDTVNAFPTGTSLDCDTSNCGAGIVDAAAAVDAVTTVPSADAGVDQNVGNGQLVTLNVTVVDDTSGPFQYQWTQTAGTSVSLSGATTDTAQFTTSVSSEVLSFEVSVTDDVGLMDTDTVNVTISGTNTAPIADATSFTISEDQVQVGTLTGSDADSNPLTFSVETPPENGSFDAFNSDGSYAYRPDANFYGADSFTFIVNDGLADSAPKTVSITVNAVDDPPVAINETVRVNAGASVDAFVRGEDVDGDTLTYAVVLSPHEGLITSFNTSTGAFSYAPGEFEGSTSFTFSVDDGNSPPVSGTLTLLVDEQPAVSVNTSLASPQTPGASIVFSALANDVGTYEYEFWLRGPSTSGAWQRMQSYRSLATWTWETSNADAGTNTIWIYSREQGSTEIYATESIEFFIDDGNQAPVATSSALNVQVDTPRASILTATDADGDALTFSIVLGPSNGVITLFNGNSGEFTYTPNSGVTGADSFDYQVTDTAFNTDTETLNITITATNTPPVAFNGTLTASPGLISHGKVSGFDADGDTLSFALVASTSNGVITGPDSVTGAFTYLANADYAGSDQFRFSVDDGTAVSNGVVNITVVGETNSLVNTDLSSPQSSGVTINVQASVNDLSNPEYEFWLQGPATGGAWSRVQAYSSSATWSWVTTGADVGISTIWVYSREAGETVVHESASMAFTIE